MREWLVTNGLGGYASLAHDQSNSRKFHGILIASLEPPTKRWIFVSNLYEKIRVKDKLLNLSDHCSSYVFDFFPSFLYNIEDVKIKKTIFMPYEKNTTIIRYKIQSDDPITMSHTPTLTSRHFYDVNKQRYLSFPQTMLENGVGIKPDNIDKTLKIILKDATFEPKHYWEELYYEQDRDRNESWIDNNIHIGYFKKII